MQVLETSRLVLRPWRVEDLDDFYRYVYNPHHAGTESGWRPQADREIARKVLLGMQENGESWALVYRAGQRVIGCLGLYRDTWRDNDQGRKFGFDISQDYWDRDIVPEAAAAVIAYAFSALDLAWLSSFCPARSLARRRILEKSGFVLEGVLRMACVLHTGEITDAACYSLLREEYRARHPRA